MPESTRAALAAIGRNGAVSSAFVFACAPEALRRDFQRGPAGVVETIALAFTLDAADAVAAGDATATQFGLHPAIAQLRALFGQPWLVLAWGAARALPVETLDASITESAFDAALNPIRADVTLRAQVLIRSSTDTAVAGFVQRAEANASKLVTLYAPGPLPPIG